MIKARTTFREFASRMERLQRQVPQVRDKAIKESVRHGSIWIVKEAPKDTRRFIRGVAEAANAAECGPVPIAQVRRSSRHDEYVEQLEDQVLRWQDSVQRLQDRRDFLYPNGPPKRRGRSSLYAKLEREIDKAERVLMRAREELQKATDGEAILLFGYGPGFIRQQKGRKLSTVRDKVYGGTGRFISDRYAAWAELTILEPHAKFVERKHQLFFRAVGVTRAYGIGKLRQDLRTMAKNSGFKVKG